ncbi:hypothetical protein GCM10020331_044290 [Ectobacillus funiculus]
MCWKFESRIFTGDLNQLLHLLTYYRTYGVQLAINKVGAGMSNLERISLLSPDIFKGGLEQLTANCNAAVLSGCAVFDLSVSKENWSNSSL